MATLLELAGFLGVIVFCLYALLLPFMSGLKGPRAQLVQRGSTYAAIGALLVIAVATTMPIGRVVAITGAVLLTVVEAGGTRTAGQAADAEPDHDLHAYETKKRDGKV